MARRDLSTLRLDPLERRASSAPSRRRSKPKVPKARPVTAAPRKEVKPVTEVKQLVEVKAIPKGRENWLLPQREWPVKVPNKETLSEQDLLRAFWVLFRDLRGLKVEDSGARQDPEDLMSDAERQEIYLRMERLGSLKLIVDQAAPRPLVNHTRRLSRLAFRVLPLGFSRSRVESRA